MSALPPIIWKDGTGVQTYRDKTGGVYKFIRANAAHCGSCLKATYIMVVYPSNLWGHMCPRCREARVKRGLLTKS